MRLKNKKVLVYGLGLSGRSACKFLKEKGAKVCYYDDYETKFSDFEKVNDVVGSYDICVLSPGIEFENNPNIQILKNNKVLIISELMLGLMFTRGKVICVTGTNGKTTTVSLIGRIISESKKKVFICGNIGLPVTSIANRTKRNCFVVCEVSSFMLESSVIKPRISCILNISDDHLNRHKTLENYLEIKTRIYQYQKSGIVVLNFDDERLRALKPNKKVLFFSRNYITNGGYSIKGKVFFKKKQVTDASLIRLMGEKNLENILAAITICGYLKIKPKVMKNAISDFYPLKNRFEKVGTKGGVLFINDSKATNVDSAIAAVAACERAPILLFGGRNKGLDLSPIFSTNFKVMVAFGECRKEIEEVAKKNNIEILVEKTLKRATSVAYDKAKEGDIVLLAPACASFDEFLDYADRGEQFKKYFFELEEK